MVCMICSGTDLRPCYELTKHRIVGCARCGMLFNETFHEDAAFREGLFEKEYYDDVQSQAFRNRLDGIAHDPSVSVYRHYLEEAEKTVAPGRVLDVGCAFGTFLKVARDRGWQPSGVEVSQYSSAAARKRWGLDVFTGDLSDAPLDNESFDLITFWDVIEHVLDPRRALERAWRLLRPGGCVLVTTDNFDCFISSLGSLAYRASIGHLKFPVERFFIPHNACYFTPATWNWLCAQVNLRPIFFERIDYPIDKLDLSGVERLLVKSVYVVGDFINKNSQFISIVRKEESAANPDPAG